jgi:hypothetical protein
VRRPSRETAVSLGCSVIVRCGSLVTAVMGGKVRSRSAAHMAKELQLSCVHALEGGVGPHSGSIIARKLDMAQSVGLASELRQGSVSRVELKKRGS